eukprot:Awhi_evm1s9355
MTPSMPAVHIANMATDNVASTFMNMVQAEKAQDSNFEEVVEFLKNNYKAIVKYVHDMDKLMIDDGKVMLNCPPAPEKGNNHGDELIRTYAEIMEDEHIAISREFKVHLVEEGKVEVRVETK